MSTKHRLSVSPSQTDHSSAGRWRLLALLALVLSGALTSACTHHIRVGPPELLPGGPPPEPPVSVFVANIRTSLDVVAPALDDAVPDSFNTDSYCIAFGLACVRAYLSREPFRFTIQSSRLRLASMIHYQMDGLFGFFTGSCGRPDNPRRRAGVSLESDVFWDPGWTLQLRNSTVDVTAIDRCKVTAANIDVTGEAVDAMKRGVEKLPERANERLQTLGTSLRARLATTWSLLNTPIALGSDASVSLRPSEMSVTPFSAANETLTMTAGLSARPYVAIGQPPPSGPVADLPILRVEPLTPDFHVAPVVAVAFRLLNVELGRRLVGLTLSKDVFLLPDPKVTITGTHVFGAHDEVAIGLELDGTVEGTAWFVGKVQYDSAVRTLRISLVDFTIDTRNAIVQVADWLVPKLIDEAINRLVHTYTYELGPSLDDLRSRITVALNRDFGSSVRLTTTIESVNVSSPFTRDEAFSFLADMKGRATLDIGADRPLPTGREIRLVHVAFRTVADDKDAEEPVDLWFERKGIADPVQPTAGAPPREILAHRRIGITERFGDGESQGPYSLRILPQAAIADCRQVVLRIRKVPDGSATGKGWNMAMTATLTRADGRDTAGGSSPPEDWGDGHSYDRRFGLCAAGAP